MTEDDTFKVLRGATFEEAFLIATEDAELGHDLGYGKEDILRKYGWRLQDLRVEAMNRKILLDLGVIRNPKWRAEFLAKGAKAG